MKLEVGMLVRTKITDNCNCVYIRKIEEIDDEGALLNQICIDEDVCDGWGDEKIWIDIEDISKASHNIIDLIEVGDYVNGFKIIRRFVNIHNGKKLLIALEKEEGYEYSNNLNDYMGDDSIHIYDEDIKTIVTKEQFESCMYKVGE